MIEVDRARCMGTGACAFAAPDVFDVDASGRAVVIGEPQPGDERVSTAIAECPVGALRFNDDGER